jgi:glycosyltransferase involved in cell wall biosynthesis
MRLLLITNAFPNPFQPNRGLFNRQLFQAVAKEHQVHVISPVSWIEEWQANARHLVGPQRKAEVAGIPVDYPRYYYTPKVFRGLYGWFFWLSIRRQVQEALATFKPDVVLGYWAHPDGEAAVRAARQVGVPAAIMVGGSDVLVLTLQPSRRRKIVQVLQSADAVIAVSQDLKEKLIHFGVPPHKIHVVYRGVDRTLFAPGDQGVARQRIGIPIEGPVLLSVGRMVEVKGLDVLLEACSHLCRQRLAFHLYLVGDGPLRKSLEEQSRSLGLSDAISFVGVQSYDQLPDWYRAADLMVLPSRSEGVPNVLREAKACGIPFVASRVGGIAEIAREPHDKLVPPGDPLALAEAIARGLTTPTTVKHFSEQQAPDWTQSASALLHVLESLISARSSKTHSVSQV